MRLIIAGSRRGVSYPDVEIAIKASGFRSKFKITEVICGMAHGADILGLSWAQANNIPVKEMPADWDNIKGAAIINNHRDGTPYNAQAGHERNQKMVDRADAALFLWDGKSRGTKDCIDRAKKKGIPIYIHRI